MIKFHTLGTSHGAAEYGRSCSVNILEVNGRYYVFDCGGNIETKMKDLDMPMSNIKAVFISHMHEDHAGSLSAIGKHFTVYNSSEEKVKIMMPEAEGIRALRAWMLALHLNEQKLERLEFEEIYEAEIYRDEFVAVSAIATRHIKSGRFPSYAFVVEAEGKKILYTGDLASDFSDYPKVLYTEDFDLVVSELVHFNPEANLGDIKRTRTKKLVFTHISLEKAQTIREVAHTFPFEVTVAEENDSFAL